MFKKILKIVGIVLGCTVVGVGILAGVLALQGKFKEPYQEPDSIYFDLQDGVLNVTYYCDNFVASKKDEKFEFAQIQDNKNRLNIYSFKLKATPDDVTELDCTMTVARGSELIEFCDKDGNLYSGGSRSKIKIGEEVYFKIKNTFDNSDTSLTNTYEATGGEVKLYFNTSNGLHNADLTIKIDRQTSQVSLMDWNNLENNTHTNGVFDFESANVKYEKVTNPTEEKKADYYIYENSSYRKFGDSDTFSADNAYYQKTTDTTLYLNVEANTEFKLQPIFAPDNSNKPFKNETAKLCDIFYKGESGNYYNITETAADFITKKDGEYYFNASQAGEYEMYVVSYPTYDVQQLFLQNFDSDSLSDKIFNNEYSVYRKVKFVVENSGVTNVYFNGGNTLNIDLDLFQENELYVQNNSKTNNLDLSMENNMGTKIYSRFNQLEFLNLGSAFQQGNVEFKSGNKKIALNTSATLTGFDANNGTYSYTISYGGTSVQVKIGEIVTLNIPCTISGEYTRISQDANITGGGDSWTATNSILLVRKTTDSDTANYQLGTIKVGAYLVMKNSDGICNDKFEIIAGGYGTGKMWNIVPIEGMVETSLYCLVVNTDKTAVWTSQPASVSINYQDTTLKRVLDSDIAQTIKISASGATQSYKIEDLIKVEGGTYQYPLMFVRADNIKVRALPQIYFEKNGTRYVLVGYFGTDGQFKNEVVPLNNQIGEQTIYSLIIKYNYNDVKNTTDLLTYLFDDNDVFESVILSSAPADWSGYYTFDGKKFIQCGNDTKFDSTTIYYCCSKFEYQAVELSEAPADWSGYYTYNGTEYVECGADTQFNSATTYFKRVEQSKALEYIDLDGKYQDFDNVPIVTFNLAYVYELESDNQEEKSLKFDLAITLATDEEASDKEASDEEAGKVTSIKEEQEFTLSVECASNSALMKLIASVDNGLLQGLNKYFTLGIDCYTSSGAQADTAFIQYKTVDGETTPTITGEMINQWFEVEEITLDENNIIQLKLKTKSDAEDRFLSYAFAIWFEYNGDKTSTNSFTIQSTAVTGYQFKVGENTYSFDDYKIVYTVDYSGGYVLSAKLVKKNPTEASENNEIELPDITGLTDENMFKASDTNGTYITTLNGQDNKEFAFNLLSSNENVLSFDKGTDIESNNALKINGKGQATITLQNKVKTSVTGIIQVEVLSNLEITAKEKLTINTNSYTLNNGSDNVFSYKSKTEGYTEELFDIKDLMGLKISYVKPNEFAIGEDQMSVVDRSQKGEDGKNVWVAKVEYTDSQWILSKNPEYELSVLSFNLTAYSPFADKQTVTVEYTSSVKIEKNPDNAMSEYKTIPYYVGTQLVLATNYAEKDDVQSLFKLTNGSGTSTTFQLQIYWYKQVEGTTGEDGTTVAPTFDVDKYYTRKENGSYQKVTSDNAEDFAVNYATSYYEWGWITLSSGAPLTCNFNYAPYYIPYGEEIQARIYYTDKVTRSFKLTVLENVFIETSTTSGDTTSENTKSNPQTMTTDTEIALKDILKAYQYDTSKQLVDYTSASKTEISDVTYSINKDDTNTEMFSIADNNLKLVWVNATGSNVYTLKIDVTIGGKTYTADYYVRAQSSYTISKTQNLPNLNAFEEKEFDVTEYFTIKNGSDDVGIASATIKCYVDEECTQEDANFKYNDGKLVYKYPYISNNTRYLVFAFKVDGKTLTDNVAYPIAIENFKLAIKQESFVAETETNVGDLFNLDVFAKNITKIQLSSTDDRISFVNNTDIIDKAPSVKIKANSTGQDYTFKIKVTIYTNSDSYIYTATLKVKNKYTATVEYTPFGDLTIQVKDTDTVIDTNGEKLDFVGEFKYQPVLSGEKIINLQDRFKVFEETKQTTDQDDQESPTDENISTQSLTETEYKLSKIELYATIGLSGVTDYKNKFTINNNDLTIAIGGFDRVGYAIFKLSASNGTSCYFVVRITPQTMSTKEKYTGVLETDNLTRKIASSSQKLEEETTLSDAINLTNIANTIGVTESLLSSNNLSYYLIEENNYLTGKGKYDNVSNYTLTPVVNPKTIKLAVLIKTTNGEVYICDYQLTITPNIDVTLKGNTTTEAGDYTYGTTVKYSYEKDVTNQYSYNDILTVTKGGETLNISSVLVEKVSDNKIGVKEKNINDIITFGTTNTTGEGTATDYTYITLNKNISEQIAITIKLTYELNADAKEGAKEGAKETTEEGTEESTAEEGFVVTLIVVYEPYQNTNTTRLYNLGWNGTTFVNSLNRNTLISDYTGTISATINEGNLTTTTDGYSFELSDEQQTKTLTLKLDDIVGTPSYTFTITLSPNINSTYKMGETANDSVSTTVSSTGSVLSLGLGDKQLILYTNSTNGEEIFVLNYADTISDVSVAFYDLNGNEMKNFVSLVDTADDTKKFPVQFIDSASDINGILKITANDNTYPIYVTMSKTYEVNAQYRITGAEYETMLTGSTIKFDDFMSTRLQTLTVGDITVNSSRFDNMSKTYGEDVNSFNKANWKLMYQSSNGLVEDVNHEYASFDSENNAFTFKKSGTVYIRIYNSTGLAVDYQIIVQDKEYFVDNVTWNQDNPNTDQTDETVATYYSTDVTTLKSDGYKLATMTFNPSKTNALTFFKMYVTSYNGDGDTGTNSYDASDETRGSFTYNGVTLRYEVKNFNVCLTIDGADSITFAYFDIVFVTVNGANTKIRLYVTNTTITTGTTGLEYIYANQEGLSLSTKLNNDNKRVTIKNGDKITYNDSGDYKLYYFGATNVTKGVEYAADDKSLVDVNSANGYMTDEFSLKSIASDNNIKLHYYLTCNGIRIATFSYQFVIQNDINITVNNFDNSSNTSEGAIYLNNYPYASNEFTVDLINKTYSDETDSDKTGKTYYRNEYIVYKNLRTGQTIFGGGDNGKNVASYMKFELIDSYLGTSSRDVFSKDEVEISQDGKLTITADKSGTIGVKITAQYCPTYSITVILNVEATVKVDQKYSDTEANADQISAYKPLDSVNLITRDKTQSAALTWTESKTNSSYEWANSNSSIDVKNDVKNDAIEVSYKISSSITTGGTYTKLSSLSFQDNIISVTLPVVPFSETASYIVTYKVTITVNGTARVYYCNYEVKNDAGIAISDGYKDQTITVGDDAQTDTNLTIFKENITDKTALFTSGDIPSLLKTGGAEYIRFENIVDATGSKGSTGFMNINSSSNIYSISLGSSVIFSNSMTFDIVFYDSAKTTELYRSTGWTMTATDKVTPKNSKALLDIFTEAELGNNLLDKNFVAVTTETSALSSWFESGVSVDPNTSKSEQTITREAGTYYIYSFTASKSGGGAFYNLQGTFYFISGSPTDFVVTDNWYISYIVKDSSADLTIDIKNNAQVFSGSSFETSVITSISSSDNPSYVTIDGTTISITSEDLGTLKDNNITSCEFYITISGGSTSRTVKVVITFDFA